MNYFCFVMSFLPPLLSFSFIPLGRFEINVNTGHIQVKSLLDREKLANYKLNVRANDRGAPSLFSNKVVLINVKDVNDNSPVFTKSLYNGIIAEDASKGSVVVQVCRIYYYLRYSLRLLWFYKLFNVALKVTVHDPTFLHFNLVSSSGVIVVKK